MRGASILVLGVRYKPDVNDIRESTALLILDSLKVTAVEPSPGAMAAADCVILTNHSRFDYAAIATHASLVVHTRTAMKANRRPGRSIFTL